MKFLKKIGNAVQNLVQGAGQVVGNVVSSVGGAVAGVVGSVVTSVGQSGIVQQVADSAFGQALGGSILPTGVLNGIMPNEGGNTMDNIMSMFGQLVSGGGQQPPQPYAPAPPKIGKNGNNDDDGTKWYQQKWFLPTAIGAGVLTLGTVVYLIVKPNKNRI